MEGIRPIDSVRYSAKIIWFVFKKYQLPFKVRTEGRREGAGEEEMFSAKEKKREEKLMEEQLPTRAGQMP